MKEGFGKRKKWGENKIVPTSSPPTEQVSFS